MSRVLEACDAVADFLSERIEEEVAVSRRYVATDEYATMTGRKIRVYPEGYTDAERLTKRRTYKELRVVVVVEERYEAPGVAGDNDPVPTAWVDERVDWVEESVFDPLNDKGVHGNDLLADRFRNYTCEVTVVADPQRLQESKVFFSLITVSYREQAEG